MEVDDGSPRVVGRRVDGSVYQQLDHQSCVVRRDRLWGGRMDWRVKRQGKDDDVVVDGREREREQGSKCGWE